MSSHPSNLPSPPLVNQPTAAPTRKAFAAPIGGVIGLPVTFLITTAWNMAFPAVPMDTETATALASGISSAFAFGAAYLTRERMPVNRANPADVPRQFMG